MSNIRPIGDPAIATAMLATMQSIDTARTAPSGISEPRWRILQCIAKAAPNVPSSCELRLCSGLNAAALAEHLQALRWKGLIEMDGLCLSATAADMVGLQQPYPPKDMKRMTFAPPPEDFDALSAAISAASGNDFPLTPLPMIIDVDFSTEPNFVAAELAAFGADGKIEPLDPADVPACMRPDCMPPAAPIPAPKPKRETEDHGRGGATVAHPSRAAAGSNPAPGQPATSTISELVPPPSPPKFTSWIDQRHARIAGAIAFLKTKAILVTVADRDAPIRQYFVTGKRYRHLAEEVVELAIEKGWVE